MVEAHRRAAVAYFLFTFFWFLHGVRWCWRRLSFSLSSSAQPACCCFYCTEYIHIFQSNYCGGNFHVYFCLAGEMERSDEIIMKRRQNGRIIDTQIYVP